MVVESKADMNIGACWSAGNNVSKFVRVGSAHVAYRVLGMGPAVLLVNGTRGGDGHWGDLIERLARSRLARKVSQEGEPL